MCHSSLAQPCYLLNCSNCLGLISRLELRALSVGLLFPYVQLTLIGLLLRRSIWMCSVPAKADLKNNIFNFYKQALATFDNLAFCSINNQFKFGRTQFGQISATKIFLLTFLHPLLFTISNKARFKLPQIWADFMNIRPGLSFLQSLLLFIYN